MHVYVTVQARRKTNTSRWSTRPPSRFLKRMSVRHQAESDPPFNADRDLEAVVERGGLLRDASEPDFRHQSLLIDVTYYADLQAGVHPRAGVTNPDGSAASTSEPRKRNHYTRAGLVSFDYYGGP